MSEKKSLQQGVEELRDEVLLEIETSSEEHTHSDEALAEQLKEAYNKVLTLIKQHEANRPSVDKAVEEILQLSDTEGLWKVKHGPLLDEANPKLKAILLSLSPATKEQQPPSDKGGER